MVKARGFLLATTYLSLLSPFLWAGSSTGRAEGHGYSDLRVEGSNPSPPKTISVSSASPGLKPRLQDSAPQKFRA